MEIANLIKLKAELKRFESRLNNAIVRLNQDSCAKYGCKETGALKRRGIDLKNEITLRFK